jgi:voltage-gated potassium channel
MTGKPKRQFGERIIGRFRLLLITILLMIGVRPFLDGLIAISMITDICFAGILVTGVYALSKDKWPLTVALCLAAMAVMIRVAQHFVALTLLDLLSNVIIGAFLIQMLVMIGWHIQKETEVTADLLMAAVCGYVLAGLVWAYAYNFLEMAHHHSFNGSDHFGDRMWAYIYYSFVTLTTVGYGDITAATHQARALSILEAIFGQLYLAVLIARLVGLQAMQGRDVKNS